MISDKQSLSYQSKGKIKLKIVFLGDIGVGKSSLIKRYINDSFQQSYNPTIGIDFLARNQTYLDQTYRLQLWDTAGQQRYMSLIPNYLKNANCSIIVYDINNKVTFERLKIWINLFNNNKHEKATFFLIGNKIDLKMRIEPGEPDKISKEYGVDHFYISAKTGQNIQSTFLMIIKRLQQISKGKQIHDNKQLFPILTNQRITNLQSAQKQDLPKKQISDNDNDNGIDKKKKNCNC